MYIHANMTGMTCVSVCCLYILDLIVTTGGESDYHGHPVEDDGDHRDKGQYDEHENTGPRQQDSG